MPQMPNPKPDGIGKPCVPPPPPPKNVEVRDGSPRAKLVVVKDDDSWRRLAEMLEQAIVSAAKRAGYYEAELMPGASRNSLAGLEWMVSEIHRLKQ